MKKNLLSGIAIYVIILLVYILLVVMIPFAKSAASWIQFGFSVFAIIGSLAASLYAFGHKEELSDKFYGYPIFKAGTVYAIGQIVISIVFYIIGAFIEIPCWIALIAGVIILSVAFIFVIIFGSARRTIECVDNEAVKQTRRIKSFRLDISEIIDMCDDTEIKKAVKRLAEDIRYSDPVSCSETEEIETKISEGLSTLKKMIQGEPVEKISEKVKEIDRLVLSRRRICRETKK